MTKIKILTWGSLIWVLASILLVSGCLAAPATGTPAPGAPSTTGFDWTTIIFFLVIIAMVYFFFIRPQSSRRKQQQKLMANLKVGDQIVTLGGMYGEIESMEQESIVLKVESGAKIRISRQSVAGKRPESFRS